MNLSSLIIPVLLSAVAIYGMGKRVDVYSALTKGAEEGLGVLLRILPALVGLLTAVAMFRASGAAELFSSLCAPVLEFFGIPPETAPLMLIRPVSGSGALAVGTDLMTTCDPVAVYCGSAGSRKTRHAVPAALVADLVGFIASAWAVKLLFG